MKKYDVALSFAGEDREYVKQVANYLKEKKISVFYDMAEQTNLWGKNLYDYLSNLYQNDAKYTVMFISKHYALKRWTNLERQAMQAKAFISNQEYILPVRFDDTEILGLLSTVGYISLNNLSPKQLSEIIVEKIKTK